MAEQEQNALWQLFSGHARGFQYGDAHYHWQVPEDKLLLNQLYQLYLKGGVKMSYTFEEFHRDYTMPFIESVPFEMRLEGMPFETRLEGIPLEERLKGQSPEEVFKQFTPEEMLKQLSPEEIEAYLLKLKKKSH